MKKDNCYTIPLAEDVGDMVTSYNQAKDKKRQIDILADMCDTKPCRIAWLLDRAGCDVPAKKMPQPDDEGYSYIIVWEMSEEGKKADEIRKRYEEMQAAVEKPVPGIEEAQATFEPVRVPITAEEITAMFWEVYTTFSSPTDNRLELADVRRMLQLANIAKEMAEDQRR